MPLRLAGSGSARAPSSSRCLARATVVAAGDSASTPALFSSVVIGVAVGVGALAGLLPAIIDTRMRISDAIRQ